MEACRDKMRTKAVQFFTLQNRHWRAIESLVM
jgi:hypothetical protein